jgi:hypothetical protein
MRLQQKAACGPRICEISCFVFLIWHTTGVRARGLIHSAAARPSVCCCSCSSCCDLGCLPCAVAIWVAATHHDTRVPRSREETICLRSFTKFSKAPPQKQAWIWRPKHLNPEQRSEQRAHVRFSRNHAHVLGGIWCEGVTHLCELCAIFSLLL